jgi:hypothetical protein
MQDVEGPNGRRRTAMELIVSVETALDTPISRALSEMSSHIAGLKIDRFVTGWSRALAMR